MRETLWCVKHSDHPCVDHAEVATDHCLNGARLPAECQMKPMLLVDRDAPSIIVSEGDHRMLLGMPAGRYIFIGEA